MALLTAELEALAKALGLWVMSRGRRQMEIRSRTRRGWPAALAALFWACGTAGTLVQLRPEEPSTLHVGEIAAVSVASAPQYTVGSAGAALAFMKRTEEDGTTVYVYRAVAPGNQTLVLTPRDPGADGCVSCVTVRYFIEVAR